MNNYKKLIFNNFDSDIWTLLKNSNLPILIYGMGNGADKIISVFERKHAKRTPNLRLCLQIKHCHNLYVEQFFKCG